MSQNTLQYLKTDQNARYQGYTYFFNEGFCWTNILNPQARLLKTKLKSKTVNDVGSMSLLSIYKNAPNYFFVILLNSELLFDYYREFINCTVNIQINDIRQLPIIIPTQSDLDNYKLLFQAILQEKIKNNKEEILNYSSSNNICKIETKLDEFVAKLYKII